MKENPHAAKPKTTKQSAPRQCGRCDPPPAPTWCPWRRRTGRRAGGRIRSSRRLPDFGGKTNRSEPCGEVGVDLFWVSEGFVWKLSESLSPCSCPSRMKHRLPAISFSSFSSFISFSSFLSRPPQCKRPRGGVPVDLGSQGTTHIREPS